MLETNIARMNSENFLFILHLEAVGLRNSFEGRFIRINLVVLVVKSLTVIYLNTAKRVQRSKHRKNFFE